MMGLSPQTKICRNDSILTADIDGEIVLMDAEQGLYFGLNASGSEIWRRLADRPDLAALTDQLCQHFQGDPAIITQETQLLIENLLSHGLVAVDPI